jgi:hypothetical protein
MIVIIPLLVGGTSRPYGLGSVLANAHMIVGLYDRGTTAGIHRRRSSRYLPQWQGHITVGMYKGDLPCRIHDCRSIAILV